MRFDVITLFPELVSSVVESGVTGRALNRNIIDFKCWNPRDYSTDVHNTVDDRPYGGGPGMVMKADCLLKAIRDARAKSGNKVIYLSPQGKKLDQEAVRRFSDESGLILLCGRYEGIDERVIGLEVDEEWSIGDYVLSGGELGAMVIVDAVTRLLPEALGHNESAIQDSFTEGLLDCPHYTRPEMLEGLEVPAVLKSGNHGKIDQWRLQQALGRTYDRRPDLLKDKEISKQEEKLLAKYLKEKKASEVKS